MRYLIDTNIFIRLIEDNEISDGTKTILEDYGNIINVSSESIKEFVHLVQNDKIVLKKEFRLLNIFDLIENIFGLNIKYVAKEHLNTFAKLDLVEGQGKRMLIS